MTNSEKEAVRRAWEDNLKTFVPRKEKNQQFTVRCTINRAPGHGIVKKNNKPPYYNCTGILIRGYSREDRAHQFHLGLYTGDSLKARDYTGEDSIYNESYHLRAFKRLIDMVGQKISFCIGFYIDPNGLVRRNSCVNERYCEGSRTLSDSLYMSLLNILRDHGYTEVKSDMEDSDDSDDEALNDLFKKGLKLGK